MGPLAMRSWLGATLLSIALTAVLAQPPSASAIGTEMLAEHGAYVCFVTAQSPDQAQPSLASVEGAGDLSCSTPNSGQVSVTWSVCVSMASFDQLFTDISWVNDGTCATESLSFAT